MGTIPWPHKVYLLIVFFLSGAARQSVVGDDVLPGQEYSTLCYGVC